jgi:hypothetical protein
MLSHCGREIEIEGVALAQTGEGIFERGSFIDTDCVSA